MPRIKILSRIEIQDYDKLPIISEKEWNKIIIDLKRHNGYFSRLRVPSTKVIFTLQYGYFKRHQRFYSIVDLRKDDIMYVTRLFDFKLSYILSEINRKSKLSTAIS